MKKLLKNIGVASLVAGLSLSIVSCGDKKDAKGKNEKETPKQEETKDDSGEKTELEKTVENIPGSVDEALVEYQKAIEEAKIALDQAPAEMKEAFQKALDQAQEQFDAMKEKLGK